MVLKMLALNVEIEGHGFDFYDGEFILKVYLF